MKCWDGCVQIQLQNRLWARLAWLQSADPALSEAHAPGSQSEVLEAVCQQMFNPKPTSMTSQILTKWLRPASARFCQERTRVFLNASLQVLFLSLPMD